MLGDDAWGRIGDGADALDGWGEATLHRHEALGPFEIAPRSRVHEHGAPRNRGGELAYAEVGELGALVEHREARARTLAAHAGVRA